MGLQDPLWSECHKGWCQSPIHVDPCTSDCKVSLQAVKGGKRALAACQLPLFPLLDADGHRASPTGMCSVGPIDAQCGGQ